MLTCDAAAVAPLDTCRPDTLENVYEPNACQPRERRFSAATTTPLYVSEYPRDSSTGISDRRRRWRSRIPAAAGHPAASASPPILAAYVRPADEVAALACEHRLSPARSRRPSSRSTPSEYSSVRGERVSGSSRRFVLGSTIGDGLRVVACCRIESHRRRRRRCRMEGLELSGQDALIEPAVTGAQDRPAVVGELDGETETRRPDIPRIQRTQAAERRGRVAALRDRASAGPG